MLNLGNVHLNKNLVKSKETVGNSWTVLKVILAHKYHHDD